MHLLRLVWLWLQVLSGAVAALAVLWLVAQMMFHLRLLNVQTGSMRPSFEPHDALIMQHITPNHLRIGLIVSYKSTRNPNNLVTHRIVRLLPKSHSLQTEGDALATPDPVIRDSLVVGQVVAILPGLGRPLSWLQTWPGLVVCVYLPAAAITASELYRLEQHYKRRQYFYRLGRA